MLPKTALETDRHDHAEISEIRPVSEIQSALRGVREHSGRVVYESVYESVYEPVHEPSCEPAYSVEDPLEGDALSASSRRRSEYPCAYDAIAFVEGPRVLTITWLPPAPE